MRLRLLFLCFTGCVGSVPPTSSPRIERGTADSGATDVGTTDTGSASTAPSVCDEFVGIDQPAPTGCPGGGVPTDLHPRLTVEDAADRYCGVCAAGDVTFRIELVNDCAVDIEVDDTCTVVGGSFGAPDSASTWEFPCKGAPSVATIPAGSTVVWFEETRSLAATGDYRGSYLLSGGLGEVDYVICLE